MPNQDLTNIARTIIDSLAIAYGGRSQFSYTDVARAIVGQANNGRLSYTPDASPIFKTIEDVEYLYWDEYHITAEKLRHLVRTALEASPFGDETKADISSRLSLSGA